MSSRWGVAAFGLSVVAVLMSVAALSVALTRQVTPVAGPVVTAPSSATTLSGAPIPTTSEPPGDTPTTGDGGDVDPQADFTIAYEEKELRIPNDTSVDVDEPRVNVTSNTGDLQYYSGKFSSNDDRAVVNSSTASPGDCAEAIRSSPLTNAITPTEGFSMCLLTSQAGADEQGIGQKMARLTVKSIGKDDVITVLVTAWNVPA